MDIKLDIAALIGSGVSIAISVFSLYRGHKNKKEIIILKDNLQTNHKYEDYRINAIRNYQKGVAGVLSDTYDKNTYSAYLQSYSEVLQYVPEEKKDDVTKLHGLIEQFKSMHPHPGDSSYYTREKIIQDAKDFFEKVSLELSDLGFNKPLSIN